MRNLAMLMAILAAAAPALAWSSFDINTQTGSVNNDFSGSFASGTVNYDLNSNWFGTNVDESADWKNGQVTTVSEFPFQGTMVGTSVSSTWKGSLDSETNSNFFGASADISTKAVGSWYDIEGGVQKGSTTFTYGVEGNGGVKTDLTASVFMWGNPSISLWMKTW